MKNPIDIEWLMMALEESDALVEHWLDRETGIVHRFSELVGDTEEEEEAREAMETDPDRFEYIEPVGSHDAWRVMEDFIDTLDPGELTDGLTRAIHGRRPFRHFKDTLGGDPQVLQRWYDYRDRHYLGLAKGWLDQRGLRERAEYPPRLRKLG
jgi:hypothetical protein